LELGFKDNRLEKLCTDEREMRRRCPDIEKKLRLRINALRTAATVGDLPRHDPGGAWHELKGDLDGIWSGSLSGNWRLLVEPDPMKSLSAVVVTVIDIYDYH
jgi:proteic killer suppression protein